MNKNKGGRPTTAPELRTKVKHYKLTNEVINELHRRLSMMKEKDNGIKTYDDLFFYLIEKTHKEFR